MGTRGATRSALISGFSMQHEATSSISTSPPDGMLVYHRVTPPSIKLTSTILYPLARRGIVSVKKTVPKWRDARIARARTEIFEFKLRVRLLRVRMQVASSFLERQ